MTISYPMIYYRTPVTRNVDVGFTTPALLLANAPGQCIVFKRPNSSLDTITSDYNNNINYYQSLSNDGTRRINIQDNGLDSAPLTLNGIFTVSNGGNDLANLRLMSTQLNTDSYHIFGNIGFYSPNAGFFNLDPSGGTNGSGYSIKNLNVVRYTKIPNLYSFTIQLGFAGTH